MTQFNSCAATTHYSPRAALVGLGVKLTKLDFFAPLRKHFQLDQKTVKFSPYQKLLTAFVAILAGAWGLVEINKLVRADAVLARAFGLEACPDQSGVQTTLSKCSAAQVDQVRTATREIYQKWGRAYRHDYAHHWQLLDADTSGLPCGKKAALATKGYFAHKPHRRGRQLGRVLASNYKEIVVDWVFAGFVQLVQALPLLVEVAEERLELSQARRSRTIWRVDSGGGSLEDLNFLLGRGYQLLAKDYAHHRVNQLCQSVKHWVPDPANVGREVGWVSEQALEYVRPVKRVAVRCRKANGQWGQAVLVTTLPSLAVLELLGQPTQESVSDEQALLGYVYLYDQRGGGVETSFKEDKQGLGLGARNKKSFEAQAIVVELSALAHNVLIWSQQWLMEREPNLGGYGIKRLVRDIFSISGLVYFKEAGQIWRIVLNGADNFSRLVVLSLGSLLACEQVDVNLGLT